MAATPLTISGATNATPIVLTTTAPHGRLSGDAMRVAGVLGNLAANDTWQIEVLSSTTFSLKDSVGNGAYSGGGTAQYRGRVSGLVELLSRELVARLVARGLPALTADEQGGAGAIRLGQQYVGEHSAPPRVVFVPEGSEVMVGGDNAHGGVATSSVNNPRPGPERLRQVAQPAVLVDAERFRIHVWGQDSASDPIPEDDFDATLELYHAVLATLKGSAIGSFKIEKGAWTQAKAKAAQIVRAGMEIVFAVTIRMPVLEDGAYAQATSDTRAAPTTNLQLPDGSAPEVGCSDP